jgi:hypothetical protein
MKMKMQQAMKNPNVIFASPEGVEASTEFTVAQKHAILVQWKDQEEKLLIADEEGMVRSDAKSGTNSEYLRRVTDILTRLASRGTLANLGVSRLQDSV